MKMYLSVILHFTFFLLNAGLLFHLRNADQCEADTKVDCIIDSYNSCLFTFIIWNNHSKPSVSIRKFNENFILNQDFNSSFERIDYV